MYKTLSMGLFLFFSVLSFAQTEESSVNTDEPLYHQVKPTWGLELTGSLSALGSNPNIPNRGASSVKSISFQLDYQPTFLQKYGVFGLGPSFQLYPVSPYQGFTSKALGGIWSLGGQVHYQLQFFKEQPLVPTLGYLMEYWNYRLADGSNGKFFAKGPSLGLMFLLNILEPESAVEFFLSWGVSRNYLVAELRFLSGSDSTVSFAGNSLFFGLRFEF